VDVLNPPEKFDQVAVIIDWLDACRRHDLVALLDLYGPDASLLCECGQQKTYSGRSELQEYWQGRLEGNAPNAFGLDEIVPVSGGVQLDYLSHQGKPTRMVFAFATDGKIQQTKCRPRALFNRQNTAAG